MEEEPPEKSKGASVPASSTRKSKTLAHVTFVYEFDPEPFTNNAPVIPSTANKVLFQPGCVVAHAQTATLRCFPDEARNGWRFGYIQTVLKACRIFTYEDDRQRQKVTMRIDAPVRDNRDKHKLWETVSEPVQPRFVSAWEISGYDADVPKFEDYPFAAGPVILQGRRLTKLVGIDNFMLWFVALRAKPDLLVLLESYSWHMNFIYLWKNDRFVPQPGSGADDGLLDCKPIDAPVLTGKIANDSYVETGYAPIDK